VQQLHATEHLGREEAESVGVKQLEFLEVLEEFSILLVLGHDEEFGVVLEGLTQLHDLGLEAELFEDGLFTDAVADLPLERNVVLDQHLHGLDLGVQLALDQPHLPEGACTDQFECFEVALAYLGGLGIVGFLFD